MSVGAEIETLRLALDAGRILIEQIGNGGLLDPRDEPNAQRGVIAILTLVDLRLTLLGDAIRERGHVPELSARHNEPLRETDGDVILRER